MTLKIAKGDIVDVQYTDKSLHNATVLQMPRGEGDLMQVEHNGVVYAINPHHSAFLYLRRGQYPEWTAELVHEKDGHESTFEECKHPYCMRWRGD